MKRLLLIIILVFTQQQMKSQSLYVNELNGTVSEYGISGVRKIQFSTTEVLVVLYNGNTITRPFTEFKNYQYDNQSSLSNGEPIMNLDVFNVYPNPTEDQLEFNFVSKSLLPYSYIVSDITGKILFKKELGVVNGNYSGRISLATYPAGMYFLILNSGKVKISKKIIKK